MATSSGVRPHVLLFEPDGRGHAREWIEHLLDWLAASSREADVTVLTDRELADDLSPRAGRCGRGRLRIVRLTSVETGLCTSRRLVVSAFARWWALRRRIAATGAHHALVLSIDHLALPFGMRLNLGGAAVSGILFRPSVHYERDPSYRWTERLRDLRKDLLYARFLRNGAIAAVWTLDPYFPSFAVCRYARGDKVRAVPDPVCGVTGAHAADAAAADETVSQRKRRTRFLLFGALAPRKGVFELLDALGRTEQRFTGAMHVVIAGRIDPGMRRRFEAAAGVLRERRPELLLEIIDGHLPRSELAAQVARADVVLAPYQRFTGSSGVLLWAASAGKPVLTQSYGLLGRLVADYRLGIALDTTDPSEIAAAMIATVRNGTDGLADATGMARFVAAHSAEVFAARIMQDLLGFSFDDAGYVTPEMPPESSRKAPATATD